MTYFISALVTCSLTVYLYLTPMFELTIAEVSEQDLALSERMRIGSLILVLTHLTARHTPGMRNCYQYRAACFDI
jgi:hypothetical protein